MCIFFYQKKKIMCILTCQAHPPIKKMQYCNGIAVTYGIHDRTGRLLSEMCVKQGLIK